MKAVSRTVIHLLWIHIWIICGHPSLTVHTQSTLSDGHHLSSVCRRQLPEPGEVPGLSALLKLSAAGGMAADRAAELICNKRTQLVKYKVIKIKHMCLSYVLMKTSAAPCTHRYSLLSLPLVSASLRASLLSSRFPPVIINCNKET